MARLSNEELIDAFKEMTMLELSEFVNESEVSIEVITASTVDAIAADAPADVGSEYVSDEEQSDFFVVLVSLGDKKIQVIKEVRSLTSLCLKESKDLVDGAPKPVLEGVDKEAADKAKEALEGAGATVTLK